MKSAKPVMMVILLALGTWNLSAQNCDRLIGVYKALGQDTGIWSKVKFTKVPDGTYEGRVIWVDTTHDEAGKPLRDINNPDPELRGLTVDRIRVVWGVSYNDKKDTWTGGKVYNPVDGKTYDVQISFDRPDRIKVRGYVGAPAFGRNFFWDKLE